MFPRPHVAERWSPHGRWRPPKANGHNLKLPPVHFYFNGNATFNIEALPGSVQVHRTFSIYHDRAIFWTIDYDATGEQVSDGNESDPSEDTPEERMAQYGFQNDSAASSDMDESSDDEDHPRVEKDDWAPLKFDHRESDRLSYAGRHQPHHRLRIRRSDQDWPQKLLPDTCSAREMSDDPGHGGLIGELPLLLGLMALAIPEDRLAPALCQSIGTPWRAPSFDREAGWEDKRGLVITTYACPPHSSIQDIVDYEQGKHGIILP